MGRGRGRGCGGWDWDELLAYDTVRFVRIKSACVGLIYYFFMFVIAAYLVGYVFLYQKKFIVMDTPVSNARFSTMGPCQPTSSGDLCKRATKENPIAAVGEACTRAFICNRHAYCSAKSTVPSSLVGGQAPCVYWDHNAVTYPPSELNALTLASRVSTYQQRLETPDGRPCGPPGGKGPPSTDWDCQYQPSIVSGKSYDSYVADIANFTISISLDVTPSKLLLPLPKDATGNTKMSGDFVRCKAGKTCDDNSHDTFEPVLSFVDGHAEFTVAQLLHNVVPADRVGVVGDGVVLSNKADACPKAHACKSYSTGQQLASTNRWMGFAIILDIEWDNTGTLIVGSSFDNLRYRLRAWLVPSSTFRVEVAYPMNNNTRTIQHLHGMRVLATTKGHLGQFSFNSVLIQLTTSLTLLAVATAVVDLVLAKFMRNRDYYNALKYQDEHDAIHGVVDANERDRLLKKKDAALDFTAIATGGLVEGK